MNDEERAAEIAADCVERRERGERVDTDEIVRAHPRLAVPLRHAFAALRRLDEEFADARAAPSRLGATLGPYHLDAELGAGGMGTVYLATLAAPAAGLDAGARVAVKVLHAHLVSRPGFRERFLREAAIGTRIRHGNVVATLGSESLLVGGAQVDILAMEYVEGRTLRALLDDLGRVPEELCRHIGCEIAKALAAIHAEGAVHRDLKPDNVIVTREHVVKVMDLGVARLVDQATRLSQTGAFVGSLRYAAPEQLGDGGTVDARADLHALGLTLYELATGAQPFEADDVGAVVRKVLDAVPRPAGELNPQLSPFFEELLARLLEKDRKKRPESAAAVARILEQGEEGAWWKERAASLRRATKRPLRRIRIPRETALYGRDAELTVLRSLYERACEGHGCVALLEGEAGIGKSRLVDEFVGQLAQAGADVNFLFGSYPPAGAATVSGAFIVAYREHLGDDEDAIRAALPQTPLLVPAFAALLRGDVAPEHAEKLTKDSLQTAFVHATRAIAAQRPTIVLIDDLHFAPEEGRALFASLALAAPGHRVLLVGCARPGLDEKWVAQLVAQAQTTRLSLPRLGPKELVRLLGDALHSSRLAQELGGLIAMKSDGNPFFVFELLRGLRDGQFLRQRPDGTWETTQVIRDIQVPSSITELVQARVGDLDAEDKNLLDVAACCGFEFDPLVVAAALGIAQIPALQRLARIERRHRLVRSAGRRFVFDHHQVQEALYGGLPELLRERYHAAIAEAIETRSGAEAKDVNDLDGAVCVELAEHFLKGAQGRRALRYLGTAQTHLRKRYLNAQAVALIERALSTPGLLAGADRARTLLRLSDPLKLLGRRGREEEVAREAAVLAASAGDDGLRGQAATALGNALWRSSRTAEAESSYRHALEIARARGDKVIEAGSTVNLGRVFMSQDRLVEAQDHFERGITLCRKAGHREYEASAIGNLGSVLRSLGRFAEARDHAERALTIGREIGDRAGEVVHMGNLGNALYGLGRVSEAREHVDLQLTLARQIGDRPGEANGLGNLGCMLYSQGHIAEARELLERSLALARELGDRHREALVAENLSAVLSRLGRFAEARGQADRSLALTRELGNPGRVGRVLRAHADVAAQKGDEEEAERLLAEALALRPAKGRRDEDANILRARGALLVRLGRADEARAALAGALALAREASMPAVELLSTAQLAVLPSGSPRHHPQDGVVPAGDMVASALAALAAHEGRVDAVEAMEARFLVWQATRDPAHLAEAKRVLNFMVEHAPADCRESMLANVRLHREIAAAARDEGLPLAADS